jgi:hypothetical protein
VPKAHAAPSKRRELQLQVEALVKQNSDILRLRDKFSGLNQQLENTCKPRDDTQQDCLRLTGVHASPNSDMAKYRVEMEAGKAEVQELRMQIQ